MEECRGGSADDTELSIISADDWSACMAPLFAQKLTPGEDESSVLEGAVFGLRGEFAIIARLPTGTRTVGFAAKFSIFWAMVRKLVGDDPPEDGWHEGVLVFYTAL